MMSDFAKQFTKLELENGRLRQELAESGIAKEQVGKATKLAEEAWQENEDLKKELAEAKVELEMAKKLREKEKTSAGKAAKRLSKLIESRLGKFQLTIPYDIDTSQTYL